MKKAFLLLFPMALAFVLPACDSEDPENVPVKEHKVPEPVNDNTISTDFNANSFKSNVEADLLKELMLCDPNAPNDTEEKHPACSPKFFRFFQLTNKTPLKDGFMVMIKAGVNGWPTRRLLIFEREQGKLVKVNGFNGYLIERRPTASGYDDIVVRFGERIDGYLYFYNCVFTWKDGKYDYQLCEAINDSRIKAELMDSMAVEIKKTLDEKQYLF